jgi:hypothetical protein
MIREFERFIVFLFQMLRSSCPVDRSPFGFGIPESKKTGAPLPSLHSSKFAPVLEPTIRTGIVAMTAAVLDLMKK